MRKARLAEYYAGSYFGGSVANAVFQMALDMNKSTNEMLWMAIVGVTDLYVHERMDSTRYTKTALQLHAEVLRYNPDDADNDDVH